MAPKWNCAAPAQAAACRSNPLSSAVTVLSCERGIINPHYSAAPPTGALRPFYLQLGRRSAVNITRQSLTALFRLDAQGRIELCRLADGAVFGKPQRLTAVEQALLGNPPTQAVIDHAAAALEGMVTQAIGGRWSAPYKIPVYLDMFRQVMAELAEQE